jgi:hypothetical protein
MIRGSRTKQVFLTISWISFGGLDEILVILNSYLSYGRLFLFSTPKEFLQLMKIAP